MYHRGRHGSGGEVLTCQSSLQKRTGMAGELNPPGACGSLGQEIKMEGREKHVILPLGPSGTEVWAGALRDWQVLEAMWPLLGTGPLGWYDGAPTWLATAVGSSSGFLAQEVVVVM